MNVWNPLTSLLVVGLALLLLVLVFWPGWGLLSRWRKAQRDARRVLIEDALKHLHDCEYNQVSSTLHSLAGALSISVDRAARLVARLQALRLILPAGEGLQLAPEGRAYALRIIRVHRLWERYLADETGVPETDWHQVAERQEHRMTPEQVDALAAQMGNPQFDPHGDPIPTSSGELPSRQGVPLSALQGGEFACIIHIEDEPRAIYSQLVAQRLFPGMQVRMIESADDRVRFEADGEECILAPLFAGNVTVLPIPEEQRLELPFRALAALEPGEKGQVAGISRACRGPQRRRLMDLGLVPGTSIAVAFRSAGGDPTAYLIRGATVALRKQQAEQILIRQPEEQR